LAVRFTRSADAHGMPLKFDWRSGGGMQASHTLAGKTDRHQPFWRTRLTTQTS
jgi:hypothetical protein